MMLRAGNVALVLSKALSGLMQKANARGNTKEAVGAIQFVRNQITKNVSDEPMDASALNEAMRLIENELSKFDSETLCSADEWKRAAYRRAFHKLQIMASRLNCWQRLQAGARTKKFVVGISDVTEKDGGQNMTEVAGAADRLGRKLGYIFAQGKLCPYTPAGKSCVIDLATFTERLWDEAVSLEDLKTIRRQRRSIKSVRKNA